MKLCFATNNPKKIEEVRAKISSRIDLLSLKDIGCEEELPENQETLSGNAIEKAEYVWRKYGINCFADDTGLLIEALNNEPGVYSARYAGPERDAEANMKLVLQKLEGIENRKAQFKTVIALILDGNVYEFEGSVYGNITAAPKGNQGFGYDPIFIPDGYLATFAQLSLEEKNAISHRAIAVNSLLVFLKNLNI